MTMLMKTVSIFGVAAAMLATSVAPGAAMPVVPAAPVVKAAPASGGDVVQVQYWRDRGYYGGYRGYRDYRPRHRYHNGYWYPLAAFGAGAIIGGALAAPTYNEPRYVEPVPRYYEPAPRYVAPPPRYAAPAAGINPQHTDWCLARYRSYDVYSNTFQPNYGPRKQCYSPYF
ncbi:BA14K family protein [Neorhizobium sp. NPDC001467]|uniref:BA14K family protein n=1 Tax=Neorhizobium sp. NPDC001467 TaxID=3390595 RepID=UPI003D073DC3